MAAHAGKETEPSGSPLGNAYFRAAQARVAADEAHLQHFKKHTFSKEAFNTPKLHAEY